MRTRDFILAVLRRSLCKLLGCPGALVIEGPTDTRRSYRMFCERCGRHVYSTIAPPLVRES